MGIDIYDSANVLMLRIKAMSSAECQQWKDHINNCLDTVTNMTSAEEIASRNERVMSKHGQGRASSKLTKRSSKLLREALKSEDPKSLNASTSLISEDKLTEAVEIESATEKDGASRKDDSASEVSAATEKLDGVNDLAETVDKLSLAASPSSSQGPTEDDNGVIFESFVQKKADDSKSRMVNTWKKRFLRLTSDMVLVYGKNKEDLDSGEPGDVKGFLPLSKGVVLKEGAESMGIDIYDSANVLMLRIKAMSSAECQQWKDHINNCLDTH